MPKKQTLETVIKRAVKYELTLRGWYVFPILQGMGAHKGIADFYAIKNGRSVWLEIKTPNVRSKQSEHQVEFERRITESGGEYFVIRDGKELSEKGIV